MRLQADLTLLLVSIIWGSAFVAQRVAAQLGSVYWFNGTRYLLAAFVVLPFALRANRRAGFTHGISGDQYRWMLIAGFLLFLASALQQVGVVYTTAGNAGFITSLYVVLVPIVLFFGWREAIHLRSVVAFALAGVGAFFLSTAGRFEIRAGDAIELVGALFWTFHVVVLGKYASKFEPISFSVGQLLACGVLNLGMGIFVERSLPLDLSLFAAIAYTAFFSLGLCYTLQVWAQRHTPPADAALILSLEAVFAVIFGWFLLSEKLASLQILGCILIFFAVLLSQFRPSGKFRGRCPNLDLFTASPKEPQSREGSLRGKIDSAHPVEDR